MSRKAEGAVRVRLVPLLASAVLFTLALWCGLGADVLARGATTATVLLPLALVAALVAVLEIRGWRAGSLVRTRTLVLAAIPAAGTGFVLATGIPHSLLVAPAFGGFWFALSAASLYGAVRPGLPPWPDDGLGVDAPLQPAERTAAWPAGALVIGAMCYLSGFAAAARFGWGFGVPFAASVPVFWLATFRRVWPSARGWAILGVLTVLGSTATMVLAAVGGVLVLGDVADVGEPVVLLLLPAQLMVSIGVAVAGAYVSSRP